MKVILRGLDDEAVVVINVSKDKDGYKKTALSYRAQAAPQSQTAKAVSRLGVGCRCPLSKR